MRFRIHRGAREIGGNCVEVESGGARILLDLGRPLDPDVDPAAAVPDVAGLRGAPDPTLLGVLVSHPHTDHCGLLPYVETHVPVYIGAAAARVIEAAAPFVRDAVRIRPAGHLENGRPFEIGPFCVTPLRADHSAFDGYSLVVEADGKTLVYSGDFRSHGRTAAFRDFLRDAPRGADALLVEGTSITADGPLDRRNDTERRLEQKLGDAMREAPGLVLVAFSPQNIDRGVSMYKAATIRAGRTFVTDYYGDAIAAATGRSTVPQVGFGRYEMLVPRDQMLSLRRAGLAERANRQNACPASPARLAAQPGRYVVVFRPGLLGLLAEAGIPLAGATLIWSQWRGYLEDAKRNARTLELIERHGLRRLDIHTSGHASAADLRRVVDTLQPRTVVPMHTNAPERFRELFPSVSLPGDAWVQL